VNSNQKFSETNGSHSFFKPNMRINKIMSSVDKSHKPELPKYPAQKLNFKEKLKEMKKPHLLSLSKEREQTS